MRCFLKNFARSMADSDKWAFLAFQDIRLRYRRSFIGPFWISLNTLFFCIIVSVVYGKLFGIDLGEFLPMAVIGVVFWNFFSSVANDSCSLFISEASYLKVFKINTLNMVSRLVVRNFIIFLHNIAVALCVCMVFGNLGWLAILSVVGLVFWCVGLFMLSICLAFYGVQYRDVGQLTQNVLQMLFFVTPVVWPAKLLGGDSVILAYNPLYYLIDVVRAPLLGEMPMLESWLVSFGMLLILSIVASVVFKLKSERVVFYV